MHTLRQQISTERLELEPLRVGHAAEMVDALSDPALYEFTGGTAPDLDALRERYEHQVAGPSDGTEAWFNWIVRSRSSAVATGFVQATLAGATAVGSNAELAWVIGTPWQRQGFATEAARGAAGALAAAGVTSLRAFIHPDHVASHRVAAAIGLHRSGGVGEDGEEEWMAVI